MRVSLVLFALAFVAILSVVAAAPFHLGCTAECTAYWTCKARGAWKGATSGCNMPRGCECRKFAWQSDAQEEMFADGVLNLACTQECGVHQSCVQQFGSKCRPAPAACRCPKKSFKTQAQADAPFHLGCTAECAAYWTCKARGAWNGATSGCDMPRGCECRRFAWEF